MAYSKFQIEVMFNALWEDWINKDGESSARKAFTVFLNSGLSKEELTKACKAYTLENVGNDPSFTLRLSNFINQDHWKDILENSSIETLERKHNEALQLIECWNKACKNHWCKVMELDEKVSLAKKALSNKSFKSEWKKALGMTEKLFRYPLKDGDPRQKIILSFRWFTNVSDKHTVMRIVEGEYGYCSKEVSTKKEKPVKEVTKEERARVMSDFYSVFPDLTEEAMLAKLKKEQRKEQKQNERHAARVTNETGFLVDGILKSVGPESEKPSEGSDEFTFD